MIICTKLIVIGFGLFIICAGFVMLIAPERAKQIVSKAGSTNLINYLEITIRVIPAIALVLYSDLSKYPAFYKAFGWIMLVTSLILLFVPRRMHHNYAFRCATVIQPFLFRIISLFAFGFGGFLIYGVMK